MSTTQRRPNVVFILADDLGWGDLGCFGHHAAQTPHLDRLASQGTRFTQFYANAPVCSPSRAAFLTGRFPGECGFHYVLSSENPESHRSRGVPDFLGLEYPTISQLLQNAGYRTAHFGKWHIGSGPDAPDPGRYGFDQHRSTASSGPALHDGDLATFRPHSSQVIVDQAIDWLGENQGDPFYLQLWLLDPHAILDPTDEQMKQYAHLSPAGVDQPGAMTVYYSVLSELDRHLGRLFTALDNLGVADDTIVIFTSDNGPEEFVLPNASHSAAGSSGPFRGRKRSLYEGGTRMPLIVRWPGHTPAGQVDDDSVLSGVDLLPTLCGLAEVETPKSDGEDVRAALVGHDWRRQRPLMWEYRFPNVSHPVHCSPSLGIRLGNWKLLLNPDHSRVELYDIPSDPMEMTNRADDEAAVVDQLSSMALEWARQLPDGPYHARAGSNAYDWPRDGISESRVWEPAW